MKTAYKIKKRLHEPIDLTNWQHFGITIFAIIFFALPSFLLLTINTPNSNQKAQAVDNYKVLLDLYPQDYAILRNPDAWLAELTDAYSAYSDLVGIAPYSGQAITMKEYPVGQMSGAEMYAGNPIHWLDSSVPTKLANINDHNDLSFGPIHELGHDFDITPYSYYYIGSGNTPINAEQWANFKLTYIADTLSSKYPNATFYQYAVGFVPIGQFSKKYFEDIFMQEWLASSKSDWKTMKADAYTGFLHSLATKYGWDMFKKTFRDYQTITDPLPTDDLQKVNLFVSLLSKNSGANIKQEFINFGIPVGDYVPVPNPAPAGYIFCSSEWDTCSFNGTANVAFGVNGKFVYGTYTSSVSCTVYSFSDPAYGITKACYYKITAPIITLTPTPTSSPSANLDSDGDGVSDTVENYIGTKPSIKCSTTTTTSPGIPNPNWPPDFNNDNKVTTTDTLMFRPHFNSKWGDPNYDKRYDLNADKAINTSDLLKMSPYFNTTCQS